jgi:hypothetical protein
MQLPCQTVLGTHTHSDSLWPLLVGTLYRKLCRR